MRCTPEIANYLFNYYSYLLSDKERRVVKHHHSLIKTENSPQDSPIRRMYLKKGWLSDDSQILDELNGGFEEFQIKVAERIFLEQGEDVFLNCCPNCERLARTPFARQCKFCGYDWHKEVVAQFRFESALKLKGRSIFLIGKIERGLIKVGDQIDLNRLRINVFKEIVSIETITKEDKDKNDGDIALGVYGLSNSQIKVILSLNVSINSLDVFDKDFVKLIGHGK